MNRAAIGLLTLAAGLVLALPAAAADYVGSEKCFTCHKDQFNLWQASGHPWKLRKAEKARYAMLPLPPGYAWSDLSYVIGGATKKARYIDKQGYIVTTAKDGSEAKTQYNLEDGSWSFYHKGEKKPYDCGPCHMTAYKKEGNQDKLPGMIGTWAEDGIGCEECHGPGSDHVKKPSKKNVKIDRSAEACGKCHQRGGINDKIIAKGSFAQHHEQVNELLAGAKAKMACTDCHNPHARADVIRTDCASCHAEVARTYAAGVHGKAGLACFKCHMPKAAKTAIEKNKYTADVRSHVFTINIDPAAKLLYEVEKEGKKSQFMNGYVTVDEACLGCHGSKDRSWAIKYAKGYHKK